MKWGANRQVPPSSIHVTSADGIKARMASQHVKELARSFTDATAGEPGNALWVRETADGLEIVAGRDRFAACLINKLKRIPVRVGTFTEREALLAKVHEGAHRRTEDRDSLLAELVEAVVAEKTAPNQGQVYRAGITAQRVKQEARESVARDAGITTQAVKSAEIRARAKAKAKDSPGQPTPVSDPAGNPGEGESEGAGASSGVTNAPAPVEPPPINALGLTLPEGFSASVRETQAEVDAIEQLLMQAQSRATRLGNSPHRLADVHHQRLKEKIREATYAVEAVRPSMVCPWCRDLSQAAALGRACVACFGLGYIVTEQERNAPAVLLYEGPLREASPLKPAPTSWPAPKPLPSARRLNITDEAGAPLPTDDDFLETA